LADLLGDDLGIGSAGLLQNRAKAWVQVELPDSIETPQGFTFRPFVVAATSFNGSMASRAKLCFQAVVCDNTLEIGMSEALPMVRVQHSRYSQLRIAEARETLGLIYTATDAISDAIRQLTEWEVTDQAFAKIVDQLVPVPTGKEATTRSISMADSKRTAVRHLWLNDERASTWWGTALGVVQAFNTYQHHDSTVRGVGHRAERNMLNAIDGTTGKADAKVLGAIAQATAGTDRLAKLATTFAEAS
jgi:phage/plasmid-like protein (TIGR03299 family)